MSSQPTYSNAYRQYSPSVSSEERSHVVDHHAPDVTAPSPTGPRRAAAPTSNGNLITVQPLQKTEMQTSYAQDLGLDGVEHGLYGTMINLVGARVVQSVVTERDAIASEIEEIVADVAGKWGVAIEGILIKDITFPPDVAASLSSAAQAKRIGESKVITARAEVDAARLMRQAADILASPAAMQIRQLEALQSMAKSAQSKVVFVPMNLQGDFSTQLAMNDRGEGTSASGAGSSPGMGGAQRAGLLTSMVDL
ncbi:hypothetical protein FRC09_014743 [Ceratobasidium sp. 395]|nr:hypothetical protein FRC09_014743 [Ceratobasidium sp. 395]